MWNFNGEGPVPNPYHTGAQEVVDMITNSLGAFYELV